jgi:chemotaxis signal transduction protein
MSSNALEPMTASLALCLVLGERRFALRASQVLHIYPMVAWHALEHPHSTTVAVVRMAHRLVPVVDPRAVLGLAAGRVELSHHLLELAIPNQNSFLLWVDRVEETLTLERMHTQGLPPGGPIVAFGFAQNVEYPVLEAEFFVPRVQK